MVRKTIGVILVLAVLGIAGHDAWRYATAQSRLRDTTYALARWAAENASTLTREQAGRQLVVQAAPAGVEVYQYGQTENGAQVWTQMEVPDTIVAGTIVNLVEGMPFSQARSAPFIIRDYREAGFQ